MLKEVKNKYKVIDKNEAEFGRIGTYIFEHKPDKLKPYPPNIYYPNGLKILRFRKKGLPYPTRKNYTCGFEPYQIEKVASGSGKKPNK